MQSRREMLERNLHRLSSQNQSLARSESENSYSEAMIKLKHSPEILREVHNKTGLGLQDILKFNDDLCIALLDEKYRKILLNGVDLSSVATPLLELLQDDYICNFLANCGNTGFLNIITPQKFELLKDPEILKLITSGAISLSEFACANYLHLGCLKSSAVKKLVASGKFLQFVGIDSLYYISQQDTILQLIIAGYLNIGEYDDLNDNTKQLINQSQNLRWFLWTGKISIATIKNANPNKLELLTKDYIFRLIFENIISVDELLSFREDVLRNLSRANVYHNFLNRRLTRTELADLPAGFGGITETQNDNSTISSAVNFFVLLKMYSITGNHRASAIMLKPELYNRVWEFVTDEISLSCVDNRRYDSAACIMYVNNSAHEICMQVIKSILYDQKTADKTIILTYTQKLNAAISEYINKLAKTIFVHSIGVYKDAEKRLHPQEANTIFHKKFLPIFDKLSKSDVLAFRNPRRLELAAKCQSVTSKSIFRKKNLTTKYFEGVLQPIAGGGSRYFDKATLMLIDGSSKAAAAAGASSSAASSSSAAAASTAKRLKVE